MWLWAVDFSRVLFLSSDGSFTDFTSPSDAQICTFNSTLVFQPDSHVQLHHEHSRPDILQRSPNEHGLEWGSSASPAPQVHTCCAGPWPHWFSFALCSECLFIDLGMMPRRLYQAIFQSCPWMASHLTKNKILSPLHCSHDVKHPVPGSSSFAPAILPHSCLSPTATLGPPCISYTSDLTRVSIAATSQRPALRCFPSSEAISFPHSSHQHHRLCVLHTLWHFFRERKKACGEADF